MKQISVTVIFLYILVITFIAGCNNEPLKPQAVVLDLREVADTTGINKQIIEYRKVFQEQMSEEMKALSDELGVEVEEEIASIGDNPSKEDEQRIKALQQQMGRKVFQAGADAKAELSKEISEIQEYHLDSIMSVAETVAIEYGASIIIKAMGVLWSEDSVDITEEVIALMQGNKGIGPVDGQKTGSAETP